MVKKPSVFNLRKLPMDGARLLYTVFLLPLFRLRRLTPAGEKYRTRLQGAAVIVANHTGFADPFVMSTTFWYRRMHWLAGEAVMRGKLRTPLLRGAGAIRIDRNIADIEAIRKATSVLKEGCLLGMFPEGGIQTGDDVQAVKTGCVLLASQANVPIIPMYIQPRTSWLRRRTVVIGDPIVPREHFTKKFPTTADMDRVAEIVMAQMNRCAAFREESLCKHSSD